MDYHDNSIFFPVISFAGAQRLIVLLSMRASKLKPLFLMEAAMQEILRLFSKRKNDEYCESYIHSACVDFF
jgi:hypothetical protein